MSWALWLVILTLAFPALCYLLAGWGYGLLGRPWFGLGFICYMGANVCFILDTMQLARGAK